MRKTILAAALTIAATVATAGEPISPAQEIQAIQSGLAILGFDPGPADGVMGPQTLAAIAAFKQDTGFVESEAVPEGMLSNAVLDAVGPALEEKFGIDPTGSWDIDWQASGIEPPAPGTETCEGAGSWYFSGGIIWRDWESGGPIVLALVEDRLETLSLPSGGFIERNVFVAVEEHLMHRQVEGFTEVWVRCDDWGAEDGIPDGPSEEPAAR